MPKIHLLKCPLGTVDASEPGEIEGHPLRTSSMMGRKGRTNQMRTGKALCPMQVSHLKLVQSYFSLNCTVAIFSQITLDLIRVSFLDSVEWQNLTT